MLRRDQEHSETLVERIRDLEQKQIKDKEQISNLVQVNEELRSLFEQERQALGDEIARLEDIGVQADRQFDRKMNVFKSKLMLAVGAF